MYKVYFETNGCSVQRHETYKMAKYFEINGFEEIDDFQNADFIVMTTCAVIDSLENNALLAIRRLYKGKKSNAIMIVAGCLPSIDTKKINNIGDDIICIKNSELSKLNQLIHAKVMYETVFYNIEPKRHHSFGDPGIVFDEGVENDRNFCKKLVEITGVSGIYEAFSYLTRGEHLWMEDDLFEIRAAYGCSFGCSYCITRKAIGDMRSVATDVIIKQIEDGVTHGYRKFMLMGDELGRYGEDMQSSIVQLFDKISEKFQGIRVGIRYMHPDSLVKYYEKLRPHFESGLIYYFCSAFQSGSPAVLKRMYRNSDISDFIKCLQDIDDNQYAVYKHTQVIVGFPGESMEDLYMTERALREGGFDYATITPYSLRKGTDASGFSGHMTEQEKQRRCIILEESMKINRKARLYNRISKLILNKK